VKVKETERNAWQGAAGDEELELSTWIRRALKNAPARIERPKRDDEFSAVSLQVRVNSDAKAGWEAQAEAEGLSLAKWVRAVLNQAARRRRRVS